MEDFYFDLTEERLQREQAELIEQAELHQCNVKDGEKWAI